MIFDIRDYISIFRGRYDGEASIGRVVFFNTWFYSIALLLAVAYVEHKFGLNIKLFGVETGILGLAVPAVFTFYPKVTSTICRLNDLKMKQWMVLFAFVPILGLLFDVYLMTAKSKKD